MTGFELMKRAASLTLLIGGVLLAIWAGLQSRTCVPCLPPGPNATCTPLCSGLDTWLQLSLVGLGIAIAAVGTLIYLRRRPSNRA